MRLLTLNKKGDIYLEDGIIAEIGQKTEKERTATV